MKYIYKNTCILNNINNFLLYLKLNKQIFYLKSKRGGFKNFCIISSISRSVLSRKYGISKVVLKELQSVGLVGNLKRASW